MALYKVLKPYYDLELGRKLTEKDKEVEMTVTRADDIHKKLKDDGYDGPFLERLDGPEKKKKQEDPVEEVEEEAGN